MKEDHNMNGRKVFMVTNTSNLTLTGILEQFDKLLEPHGLEILVSNQGTQGLMLLVAVEDREPVVDDPQVIGVDTLAVGSKLGG